MKFMNANEARQITDDANKFMNVGSGLRSLLERVAESAEKGKSEYVSEGWGIAIDFPRLMEAMRELGYIVEDLSNKRTPGGSTYLNRTLRVTW